MGTEGDWETRGSEGGEGSGEEVAPDNTVIDDELHEEPEATNEEDHLHKPNDKRLND